MCFHYIYYSTHVLSIVLFTLKLNLDQYVLSKFK